MRRLCCLMLMLVLLLALLCCCQKRPEDLTVVVKVGGEVYARLPLDEDTELEIFGIGGTNHLVIRGGAAYISRADCKNQVCVRTGAIDSDSMLGMITCLPHEVVVFLEQR